MRLAGIAILGVLFAPPAAAESPTKVFPLTGIQLPPAVVGAPEHLTRVLAAELGADVATVRIEDAAALMECEVESSPCLAKIAVSMNAQRLVFGDVIRNPGGVRVTLTRFDLGPSRTQRTFDLTGDLGSFGAQLSRDLVLMFEAKEIAPTPAVPAAALAQPPVPATAAPPLERRGGVKGSTWIALGSGLAVAAAGGALYLSGRSYRDKVAAAPVETREDFDRLVALEDTGRLRTRLGIGLAIGGGALAAAAAVRAVLQRERLVPAESRAVRVEPVPLPRGAALVLTVTR